MQATTVGAVPIDLTNRSQTLERLMDAYGDGILHLAYFYLKDRDLAEDAFQEVFTRAYLQLHTFRGESSPRTWLYRIAVNLCRDKLRSFSMRRIALLGERVIDAAMPVGSDTADEVLEQADRAELLAVVMELPLEYREVVLLYYYEEMESREVAVALGLSEGTVRSRLHRARARLKAMLTEGGYRRD